MTYLIAILLVLHLQWSEAIRCLECADIEQPHLCTKMAFCSSDEFCYIDMIVTSSGNIVFNTGCRTKKLCSPNAQTLIGKRSINTTTCTSCCMGDYCNNQGCGTKAVPRDQRGPYCYNCDALIDPTACSKLITCSLQEKCIMYSPIEYRGLPETIYRSQCESTRACEVLAMVYSGNNCKPSCCDTDFCNTKCGKPDISTGTTRSSTQLLPTSTRVTFLCNTHDGYIHLTEDVTHICVKIVTSHHNWDNARLECQQSGGDLVVLDTKSKANVVRRRLNHDSQYNHQSGYWIGANDFNSKNHFSWVNGHSVTHNDWSSGQPSHHDGQDCVCTWNSGGHYHWHNDICTRHLGYICEQK